MPAATRSHRSPLESSSVAVGPATTRKATRNATMIRVLAIGAAAAAMKRRWEWRAAMATVPAAYRTTWGTKQRSRNVTSSRCSSATDAGTPSVSSWASHGAKTTPATAITPIAPSATPSTPPATCSAPGWSSPSSSFTRLGTSTADSAPAATSSNSTFEIELADWKALPRNVVPSTAATTSTRTNPSIREARAIAPIPAAARPVEVGRLRLTRPPGPPGPAAPATGRPSPRP